MKICLTLNIILCGFLCVFPVDIIGQTCECTYINGDVCESCDVGCYLQEGWCYECSKSCYSCQQAHECDICKTGYYGQICEHNCTGCHNGSCANKVCTYGCADGYYYQHHEYDSGGYCRQCIDNCITCKATIVCTSCIAGHTGSYCSYCKYGYYYNNWQHHNTRKCIECNANCLRGKCNIDYGKCTYGCNNGWSGGTCNDACASNCISCDRYNNATCNYCPIGHYGSSCESKCSPNCAQHDSLRQCSESNGDCNSGCVDGWTESKCTEKCDMNCISCDKQDKAICHICKPAYFGLSCQHLCYPTCYDPGNGSRVCDKQSGECMFNCSQGPCSVDGTHNAQKSVNVAVIVGTVGSGVMIALVLAAVLVFMFLMNKRRNEVKPEMSVIYGNSTRESGPSNVRVIDSDRITESTVVSNRRARKASVCGIELRNTHNSTSNPSLGPVPNTEAHNRTSTASLGPVPNTEDESTYDNVYSVPDKKRRVKENVDETQSTAHCTLPKLPSNGPVTAGDVVYSNKGGVPLISLRLGVEEPEDNAEELCVDDASGSLKENSTLPKLTPPKRPVTNGDFIIEHAGCVPVIPPGLSVDEPKYSVEELSEEADWPNVENYYNIGGLTRSRVKVDTFRNHVTSISNDAFEKEFKKLPKGLTRPYGDAVKPKNVSKNRYKGIYPYDSTRVKLTWEGGDYINASYIQGYKDSEKTYIASSGPAEIFMNGYEEFWEMVWQEKVDKIVMLTNFIEESKMKCEKNWPDVRDYKTYGDIDVHCMSDERYADFTVSKLTMTKDSKVNSIHHYHFTAWPDRGTPENVVSLVEFRESVEHIPKATEGPTVVHCSAGVGRTGTYIALDILTREGRNENYVDVYGCVLGLRGQRVLMIQNVEQYRFLHYALSHSLTNKCEQIASKDFCNCNADEIQVQFQLLRSVIVLNDAEEQKAIEKNRNENYRNRKGASIPGDAHRPRLFRYNQNSKSDYINAVYVDSYKDKNRYIIAQTPLSETVEDFLGLVLQENCSCIISLDPVGTTSKQDIGDFLPDVSHELSVGKITVRCVQRETTAEYILRKLTIGVHEERTEEPNTILHYQYTEWPEESPVPSSTSSFLNLVHLPILSVRKPNMPLKPVIIHCLAGGNRSGLFPVVTNILEKIYSEEQAGIVNVVNQVRARRPSAIPNKEQFEYCYELASLFVENNSVYSELVWLARWAT